MIRLLILSTVLFLGACATTPQTSFKPPTREQLQAWQQHRLLADQITSWSLSGRIAVNTEDDGWNGDLHWSQRTDGFGINFSAPFGQGAFQIESNARGAMMRLSDGKTFQASDAESLLEDQVGWHIPLSGFKYWVTGLPEPESSSLLNYRPDGRLAGLQQGKWQVTYPEYVTIGKIDMPKKVFLENHELNLKLIIDRWVLNQVNEKGA